MIQQKLLSDAIVMLRVRQIVILRSYMKSVEHTLKLKLIHRHLIVNIGETVLDIIIIYLHKVGLLCMNDLLKKDI